MQVKTVNGISDVDLDKDDFVAPCPFCGGSADLQHTWTAPYWMACDSCSAEVSGEAFDPDDGPTAHLLSAKDALRRWNQRHAPAATEALNVEEHAGAAE